MSSNSRQSSENKGRGYHGVPSKCHCGLDVVVYTSATKQNPGRPFFRCPSKGDDHLFKWVEDGVYEEVVDALPKFSIIDHKINDAKYEVSVEIESLKARIEELKEDGMCSKRELRRSQMVIKLCLVCFSFSVIAIVIMMCITKKQKFLLGY